MKKVMMVLVALILLAPVSNALAGPVGIGFFGNYQFSDTSGDSFRETLSFSLPNYASGMVSTYTPANDGLFKDAGIEYISVSNLILDPTDYVSGNYFGFTPETYSSGFKVYDDDNTLLFYADLTVEKLIISGSTGFINSALKMNLTNIALGDSYVPGTSEIVDAFYAAEAGAANFTINFTGDISGLIINGLPYTSTDPSTYSGNAKPVPEPGTLLLLGAGLLGMAIPSLRRKV